MDWLVLTASRRMPSKRASMSAMVSSGNGVSVIDIAQRRAKADIIPVGRGIGGIAITPDGGPVLVTSWDGNSVTVI